MNRNMDRNVQSLLPDEEIVELYWQRKEKAIEATDKKYGRYLYTIAYNVLRDTMDSEECLNDTYLGTWNAIPPSRPRVLQVFLAKIARNTALSKWRQHRAQKRIPSEFVISLEELDECMVFELGEDEKYMVRMLSELLNEYLKTLSERQLFVFVCRYYYADSIEQIANMLGLSANTISRDLAKIRNGLRERLMKEGYFHE